MVKGTQKQMVVLRTIGSRYYEEAYFVLRDGAHRGGESESSMMAEANRILDECQLMPQPVRQWRLPRAALFWLGVMVGGAVLTEEYAKEIHADGYGRDAMAAVRLAERFIEG